MGWQPIDSAPKDIEILVWYDHHADPYFEPNDRSKLTSYAANAESGEFLDGRGVTVANWQPQIWESTDEYGGGYWLPGGWFAKGDFGHFETVCNATHWMPLPEPPQ